ncbi:6-phosphofructo-2-kinase/fructose-26-biphosphatase-1-like protein [Leptomonas pyrrhocoris]|uniref:6-phosphofructo-2-kinase/fructose-26-biphosphatase-1-like protein n=1 Tax=Leptomonas pyrrhocoris TaxID=157538 RepID=A0A0N0VHY0_LEPPY|nr:6-phosphofructo-2-kinase/fructose-26-biphosphatase-1-like protein [Leptomonas pyrrhocoris]KPA86734.1 6-phosphofructo-2-kinase/fructose-26-biphosphatase-1-like protein [Leptomonas pyrrhocoris]|eukprot:XP_015665173.1 6-phosphofructo-2-kinase/fructose-26-biphosphatase-1-like protein [Leptomonas pyrrhocoris]
MSETSPISASASASLAVSPQMHASAPDASIRRRQKPISFQRMAMIQEEIARIDKHLAALEESESKGMGPESVAQSNLTTEDVIDPVVLHMLTVELCQLAASGDAVGARILLNGGADPNSRDYDGSTLLHIACMNGRLSVMNVLLEFGADASLVDRDGRTPLEVAEENGFADVVQTLSGYFHTDQTVMPDSFEGHVSSTASSPASMHAPDFSAVPQPMLGSLIVVMVGLPGRGKTMVAQQIRRYFQWNGLTCSIFSHQLYRRRVEKAMTERSDGGGGSSNVDVNSPAGIAELEFRVSKELAQDLTKYVWKTSGVAILDGTQTTHARRQSLLRAIRDTKRINTTRVVFVELVLNSPEFIMANILRAKETFTDPPPDFVERYYQVMAQHEAVYKTLNPITDCDMSYIRIEDAKTYSLNMISGWMPSRLAFMLHNLSHTPVNLYLTRAGEYVDMLSGRIGGNSRLTKRGRAYSRALFNYFKSEIPSTTALTVMTSCAKRCTQTVHYFAEESIKLQGPPNAPAAATVAEHQPPQQQENAAELHCRVSYFPTLDDINHGDCEGQLLSDVLRTMPNTLQSMKADPYYAGWPNGECIHQVFNSRLEPHIHDIQASTTPVLVCSHLNLLQGLYSYFVTEGDSVVAPQNALQIDISSEYVIKIRMVGVNRVAERICLSAAVEAILHADELSPTSQ